MTRLKIFFYITLAGMIISMAGCQSPVADPDDNNGEGPAVYLKVARSALINGEDSINEDEATFEDRVHNLVMLVFDSSKGNLVGSHFEQIPLSEKSKAFVAKLSPGQRDFYFVANMPQEELQDITSRTAMEAYMQKLKDLDAALYLNAAETKGFPMSRVYKDQTITEGGTVEAPLPFGPDGEDKVKLIRVVAKLEVHLESDAVAQVKNIYFHNARKQFSLSALTTPETNPGYRDSEPLKKTGNIYTYYMPEALMTSPAWSAGEHKPVNYFVIETVEGTAYEIPIITYEGAIPGASSDYLTFATGQLEVKPDYQIYRNHRYVYTVKKLQGIVIYYDINPWVMKQSAFYMGYGYNVGVDADGKVTVSNTVDACDPHRVALKTVAPFTFDDGATEKVFDTLETSASESYQLNAVPADGETYLEVWYNDYLVKTFTK